MSLNQEAIVKQVQTYEIAPKKTPMIEKFLAAAAKEKKE